MPNTGKKKGGAKGMSETATATRVDELLRAGAEPKKADRGEANSTTGSGIGKDSQAATVDLASALVIPPNPKTVSQVFGEITWLMTQSPRHKAIPLGDLEWLVMPAILLRQFRIFYKGEHPVGVALWALVDDLVAKRIDANDKRLSAAEWKSGTKMRIIDIVAPFGGEAEMRGQLKAQRQD